MNKTEDMPVEAIKPKCTTDGNTVCGNDKAELSRITYIKIYKPVSNCNQTTVVT